MFILQNEGKWTMKEIMITSKKWSLTIILKQSNIVVTDDSHVQTGGMCKDEDSISN